MKLAKVMHSTPGLVGQGAGVSVGDAVGSGDGVTTGVWSDGAAVDVAGAEAGEADGAAVGDGDAPAQPPTAGMSTRAASTVTVICSLCVLGRINPNVDDTGCPFRS